jgi:hypothetical protein
MKRIRPWGAVTGAAVVLAASSAVYALPSQAATDLVLNATVHTATFVIPCPTCVLRSTPKGAHTGGTEYDAGGLTDAHGVRVGHFAIEETGMTPFNDGPGRVQLVGTIVVRGSQLTFQGLEEPPLDGGSVAITGGTGAYAGARGEITYADTSATVTRLTVHLD